MPCQVIVKKTVLKIERKKEQHTWFGFVLICVCKGLVNRAGNWPQEHPSKEVECIEPPQWASRVWWAILVSELSEWSATSWASWVQRATVLGQVECTKRLIEGVECSEPPQWGNWMQWATGVSELSVVSHLSERVECSESAQLSAASQRGPCMRVTLSLWERATLRQRVSREWIVTLNPRWLFLSHDGSDRQNRLTAKIYPDPRILEK